MDIITVKMFLLITSVITQKLRPLKGIKKPLLSFTKVTIYFLLNKTATVTAQRNITTPIVREMLKTLRGIRPIEKSKNNIDATKNDSPLFHYPNDSNLTKQLYKPLVQNKKQ